MKKLVALVCTLLISVMVFAQDFNMSAGASLSFSPTWISYKIDPINFTESYNNLTFGAFFDATYVQVGVGYASSVGNMNVKAEYGGQSASQELDMQYGMLYFSLLGKYPFAVAEKITVFPLAGIEYLSLLSAKSNGTDVPSDMIKEMEMDDFYLVLGGGADFMVTDKIYVRPSVTYGINLTGKDVFNEGLSKFSWSKLNAGVAVGYSF